MLTMYSLACNAAVLPTNKFVGSTAAVQASTERSRLQGTG